MLLDNRGRITAAGKQAVKKAAQDGDLLRFMNSGTISNGLTVYKAYEQTGWGGVHDRLVQMLRGKRLGQFETRWAWAALREVLLLCADGPNYLHRCTYVPADPPPKNLNNLPPEAFDHGGFSRKAGDTGKDFAHYFLAVQPSAKWCSRHSKAARQRQHFGRQPKGIPVGKIKRAGIRI